MRQSGTADNWKIRYEVQPAQSPDLNLLDLGFFSSLQRSVNNLKAKANTIDELIDNVKKAYDDYDDKTLDHIWGVLFGVYNAILKDNGDNQYKLPHRGLRKNGKNKESVVDLSIDVDAYNERFHQMLQCDIGFFF